MKTIMKTSHLLMAAGILAATFAVSCNTEDKHNTLPTESEIEVATEIDFTATAPELGFANDPAVAVSLNGATPVSVRSFTPNDAGTEATFYAMFAEDTKETRTFCAYSPYGMGFLAGSNGVNAIVSTEQKSLDDQNPEVIDKAYALAFATTTIDDNQAENASLEFHNIEAYGKLDISVLDSKLDVAKVEITSDIPFAGTFGFDTEDVTFTAGDDSESTIAIIPAASSQRVFSFVCFPVATTKAEVLVTTKTGSTYKGVVENLEGFTTRGTTEITPAALMSFNVSNPASVYIGDKDNTWTGEITTSGLPDGTEVAFTVEYSEDGGENWSSSAPSWITGLTIGSDNKFTATIGNSITKTIDPTAWLKGQAPKGTAAAPYDLSKNGGAIVNTANTYVINAAGYYSLPLVYGSAIQNGMEVIDSYNFGGAWHVNTNTDATRGAGHNLKPLVNYKDNAISSAYIYNDVTTIESACLVWEQVQGMVKNVALSADKHSLTFEIDQNVIAEGNAIVAIKDADSKIVWSWQIWVSSWEFGSYLVTVPTPYSNTSDFAPVNIGWVNHEDVHICETRSAKVRFTLEGIGLTEEKTIYVAGGYITGNGIGSYYQWGRKDPVWIGGLSNNKECMSWVKYYNASGVEYTPTVGPAGTLGSAIQNPGQMLKNHTTTTGKRQFYSNGHNDANVEVPSDKDHGFNNLWNAAGVYEGGLNNSEAVELIKTVYDPSPALYQVPSSNGLMAKKDGAQTTAKTVEVFGTAPYFYAVVDKQYAMSLILSSNIKYTCDTYDDSSNTALQDSFFAYCASMSNAVLSDSAYNWRIGASSKVQTTIVPNAALPVRPCTNRTIAK